MESIFCPPEKKKQTDQKRLDIHITQTAQTRGNTTAAMAMKSKHFHCPIILGVAWSVRTYSHANCPSAYGAFTKPLCHLVLYL